MTMNVSRWGLVIGVATLAVGAFVPCSIFADRTDWLAKTMVYAGIAIIIASIVSDAVVRWFDPRNRDR